MGVAEASSLNSFTTFGADVSLDEVANRVKENTELLSDLTEMGFLLPWAKAALRHFAISGRVLSANSKHDRLEAATTWLNDHNALFLNEAIDAGCAHMMEKACRQAESFGVLSSDLQDVREAIIRCRESELDMACSLRCADQLMRAIETARQAGVSGCKLSAANLILVDIRKVDLLSSMEHLDQLEKAWDAYALAAEAGVPWAVLEPAREDLRKHCKIELDNAAATLNSAHFGTAVARARRLELPSFVLRNVAETLAGTYRQHEDDILRQNVLMCMKAGGFTLSEGQRSFRRAISFEKAILILKSRWIPRPLKQIVLEYFGKNGKETCVREVELIIKKATLHRDAWRQFCIDQGCNADPEKVSYALLKQFLNDCCKDMIKDVTESRAERIARYRRFRELP
eukprot:TRINITY_DN57169_c0_g1_i1.p1 TRINITY_DN57169_c0_g1~~TRINITY_DN57169_c0_g1_i1.p1  ORF type:complete len:400 (-),score=51.37 TRINITY_DN57169_c0_g1_i1:185-1384(-)